MSMSGFSQLDASADTFRWLYRLVVADNVARHQNGQTAFRELEEDLQELSTGESAYERINADPPGP